MKINRLLAILLLLLSGCVSLSLGATYEAIISTNSYGCKCKFLVPGAKPQTDIPGFLTVTENPTAYCFESVEMCLDIVEALNAAHERRRPLTVKDVQTSKPTITYQSTGKPRTMSQAEVDDYLRRLRRCADQGCP